METLVPLTDPSRLVPASPEAGAALTGHDFTRADASWACLRNNTVAGCCSLWWRQTPVFDNRPCGCVGHFYADGQATAKALLEHAARQLRGRGAGWLLGPMDGDTWHSYRLITDAHGYPPFFLDLATPPAWPAWFEAADLTPVARYYSSLADLRETETFETAKAPTEESPDWAARQADGTLVIRPLRADDPARARDDLRALHALSLQSFTRNFLYTPIDEDAFLRLYLPMLPLARPEHIHLALVDGQPAAFAFSVPDMLQQRREGTADTLVFKTLARLPGPAYRGLGVHLWRHVHRAARQAGFTRIIHAFMHEDNHSLRLSRLTATPIRSYALYGRRL